MVTNGHHGNYGELTNNVTTKDDIIVTLTIVAHSNMRILDK